MPDNLGVVIEPFPYQREFLDAIEVARDRGQKNMLGVMATGLGKTVVAAFDIKRQLERRRGRVLYLCHNNYILGQARKTFEAILGQSYTYGFFHGTEKHMHHVDVLFASFQTMAIWREAFLRDEFRYIVVDEFQHAHAVTFRPTIEYFEPESMLGLTATPERGDGLDITTLLGRPVFELGLFKALGRRYLCDVDYRIMTDELQRLEVLDTPVGKLSIAELNRTIFVPKRDEEIARIIMEKTAEVNDPRVMIFCASIAHAENMAALMPHAVVIHSKLNGKEKDRRLDGFRHGQYNTVITVDMLNEGIDVPEANIIVFLRSTSSRTIFLQQLGRGLRKALGKLKVLVLDFVANCERFEMIDQLQQGVRNERERPPKGPDDGNAVDSSRPEPLTITLDGITFDERAWELFRVIAVVRQSHVPRYTYTREALAAQLMAKARGGVMPSFAEVSSDPKMASPDTFMDTFDTTWNGIAQELGLRPNQRFDYTKEELTAQLMAKARGGVMPTGAEVNADPAMASTQAFYNVFGTTWSGIAEGVGLKPNLRRDYTKEELTTQLLRKSREGVMPSQREVDADPTMASQGAYVSVFGTTWNGIAKAVGLKPTRRHDYTREELTAQLRRKARDGAMPARSAVDEDLEMAPAQAFLTVFSTTWNGIAKELGLKVTQRRDYTKAELTTQLLAKARNGIMPTVAEVNADPTMARFETFVKAFGSDWDGIARELGLKRGGRRTGTMASAPRAQEADPKIATFPSDEDEYSDGELFAYLRELTIRLVMIPTEGDINKAARRKNGIDLVVFIRRFGSLSEALARAGVSRG